MGSHTRSCALRAAVAAVCIFAQAALISLHSWHHHDGGNQECAACLTASTHLAPGTADALPSLCPPLPTGWAVDDSPRRAESLPYSVARARDPPTGD